MATPTTLRPVPADEGESDIEEFASNYWKVLAVAIAPRRRRGTCVMSATSIRFLADAGSPRIVTEIERGHIEAFRDHWLTAVTS